MDKPRIKVSYESEEASGEVDAVGGMLKTMGYEVSGAEAIPLEDSKTRFETEFEFNGKESPWRYVKLWADAIDDLMQMVDISIDAVKEIENPDEILSWFYSIRADLRIGKVANQPKR